MKFRVSACGLTILLLFILSSISVSAQTKSIDPTAKKGVFEQNGMRLTPKQLLKITESNPEAYQEMKKAKENYDFANVLGFIGGGLIGWPIGTAIGGGEPHWILAGVGGAVLLCIIPLSNGYNNRSMNAVEMYNSGLVQSQYKVPSFKLGSTQNGIGLLISF
ncbi:hypothetical protein G3O08_13550 [Cryomorpha ignava]|uniref:Glycine zipper family protein n=1 Tax=Cryomorpha ignava TaxID=101383 RepID=A0A7K3WS77_9FLAO|nr:hypothetical protein [Cryomorpha ignava]NEN24527.1 hypothetical protein [Cryomorpha ignava]